MGYLNQVISPANVNRRFYCGTSNVALPVLNKSYFPIEYQDKSRLCYYSSLFKTVEINSTFYKIPLPKTVERWASEVADDFVFTFKLWRGITHAKELGYDIRDIEKFMAAINRVGTKKGCILVQLPASVKFSFSSKIYRILDELVMNPQITAWRIAVEFRDKSWYNDNLYQALEQYRAAIVIHDMPASATPVIDIDADFCYFRFHSEKGDYRGSYDTDVLQDHAMNMLYCLNTGLKVFAYFNNTIGNAVNNAITIQQMVTNKI